MDRRVIPSVLALAVAAAAASAQDQAPAAPPRAASVELRLPPGDDEGAVAPLVAIAAGEPVSVDALRRTVQRLFQTGRYRNVVVRESPASAPRGAAGTWVRVVVEALPVRILQAVDVRVDGAAPLDAAAIRAAARLAPGEPFDDGDLAPAADRVGAALARKGWRAAEVEATAEGDRPVARLVVRPGEPVRVTAIGIGGDPGPAAAALEAALKTRVGAALDEDVLDADVRALRAALHAGGFRRSRVSAPVVRIEGTRADVRIPIDAGPHLAFLFRGNEEMPSDALARQLGFEEGLPVDLPAVTAATDRLLAFYRARGYAAARVEAEELRRGRNLAVVFHVNEGRCYRLGTVRIEGASFRREAWLRERLAALLDALGGEVDGAEADSARALALSVPGARPPRSPAPALAPHDTWDEDAWARAAERLVDGYRADGFLEAVFLGTTVALDARRGIAEPTIRLREGLRTHVESIAFEGNEAVSLPDLAREARLAPGDPLAFERVEDTRAAILRVYLARGHVYARVEAREDVDRERHLAVVRFVVSEGPKVRIGRILVTGNRRTREGVVRRALAVSEGDVYDPGAVARSQAALLRLGVFRSVSLRIQDPELPQETKDVAVEVAERPWATLSQGIGGSIANGPRALVEYDQPNLLGRALELSARGKVNYPLDTFREDLVGKPPSERIEGRVDVGVRAPSLELLPLAAAGRTGIIGEILHRRAYALRRVTGVTGVDLGLTSRSAFSLQYEIEVDRIRKSSEIGNLTQADLERLRFDEGVTTIHALRPSLSFDHRDNSAHPHRGWFATASLEYARSMGGPDGRVLFGLLPGSDRPTNMLKLAATASGYVPVGGSTVLALSIRGGRVFPLDPSSRTTIPRRFFLGGATTMRGFAEEEMIQQDVREVLASEARLCATSATGVGCTERGLRIAGGEHPVSEGGEAFLLAKVELRLRLRGSLEAGLFVDLGNVWLDPAKLGLDLRTNAGFGLRFVTPIGPAAVDIGFNLTPDRAINERIVAPHFTIGLF
jgi:outer membrane protein assembly complex protein YaeT